MDLEQRPGCPGQGLCRVPLPCPSLRSWGTEPGPVSTSEVLFNHGLVADPFAETRVGPEALLSAPSGATEWGIGNGGAHLWNRSLRVQKCDS